MVNILVVDDEPGIRDLLKMVLGSEGYAVETADSALTAFAELDKASYDLLLLDQNMPGMTGIEATKNIRANLRFARMKIIILSGDNRETHGDDSMVAGVDAYIGKPLKMSMLLKTVAVLLKKT